MAITVNFSIARAYGIIEERSGIGKVVLTP